MFCHFSGTSDGEREDEVDVATRQQFAFTGTQPLLARIGLAFWTMAVAAGVVRDGFMPAAGALIQMAAERGRSAALDGAEYFELLPGDSGSVLLDKVFPAARMMSATSKGGCFISCAACASASLAAARDRPCRSGPAALESFGQMQ